MIVRLGVHRFDESQMVDHLGGVRQELADQGAALAVLFELELAGRDWKAHLARGHAGQSLAAANRVGQFRAPELIHGGLVLEEIELRRAAGLK